MGLLSALTGMVLLIGNVPDPRELELLFTTQERLHKQKEPINTYNLRQSTHDDITTKRLKSIQVVTQSRQKRPDDDYNDVRKLSLRVFENRLTTVTCTRHDPHVLLFNRIPKCASTSIATLLFVNAERMKMRFLENPDGAYDWQDKNRTAVEKLLISQFSREKPSRGVVYAGHFYFSNFPYLDEKRIPYEYVCMIREPVDRVISSYVYYHYSNRAHIQQLRDSKIVVNESMEDCLRHQTGGCETNVMTRYFCGNNVYCKSGGIVALNQALVNLVRSFTVVGIVEDMKQSLQLFAHTLPRYFHQADKMPPQVKEQNVNKEGEPIRSSLMTNETIREKIRAANAADVILYEYARKLFRRRMEVCGFNVT